jgi:hypothetical protein
VEQTPSWEAYSSLTSQEIPHVLWNPTVHYRIHKSQWRVPILKQNLSSPRPSILFLLRSILIFSFHLRLCLPSSVFTSVRPTRHLHVFLFSAIRATCPQSPTSWFDHPNYFRCDTVHAAPPSFVAQMYSSSALSRRLSVYEDSSCLLDVTVRSFRPFSVLNIFHLARVHFRLETPHKIYKHGDRGSPDAETRWRSPAFSANAGRVVNCAQFRAFARPLLPDMERQEACSATHIPRFACRTFFAWNGVKGLRVPSTELEERLTSTSAMWGDAEFCTAFVTACRTGV